MPEPALLDQASEASPKVLPGVHDQSLDRAPATAPIKIFGIVARTLLVLGALWLFILALQLIRSGADGLRPVLDAASVDGVAGHLGFGWLGAYAVLSGSPVAAVAMSLFAGDAISEAETFAMINGSRLGASLIVLVVGFVSYVTGRRNPDGLYIGVVALLTAFTLWAPVVPIGLLALDQGWLDGAELSNPGSITSFVGQISDPLVSPLADALPLLLLFGCGIGALVVSFGLFDRALPSLERPGPRIEAVSKILQQRYPMFAFGVLMTLVTLSVSLSVTILVPLALKGYVRRDHVIPYVMGANVATWIDTLFAALLLDAPGGFTIVLTEILTGAAVSVFLLVFLYKPYSSFILWAAHAASNQRRNLVLFGTGFLAMPVGLLLI